MSPGEVGGDLGPSLPERVHSRVEALILALWMHHGGPATSLSPWS